MRPSIAHPRLGYAILLVTAACASDTTPANSSGAAREANDPNGGMPGLEAPAQDEDDGRDAQAPVPAPPGEGSAGQPAPGDSGSLSSDAGAPVAPDSGHVADGAAQPAELGPDCHDDPLADAEPLGRGFYQHFRGIFACVPTADSALYREMLPAVFEMPADPQVCFYINDFILSGVGRYHEAAILMPVSYGGTDGKYVLSMALDNRAATVGGRAVGFPKYIAEVALTDEGGDEWLGSARNQQRIDLQISYTSTCWQDDAFPWPDFINLTPIPRDTTSSEAFLSPREGSVLRIPAEHLVDPTYYSLRGRARIEIGDHLPWNGLVDEETEHEALFVRFKGGVDLGNQPL